MSDDVRTMAFVLYPGLTPLDPQPPHGGIDLASCRPDSFEPRLGESLRRDRGALVHTLLLLLAGRGRPDRARSPKPVGPRGL